MSTKKKEQEEQELRQPQQTLRAGEEASAPAAEEIDLSQWKSVVSELQAQTFASFEAAVDAVAELLVSRLDADGKHRDEMKIFVKDLFEIDPLAAEDLRSSLNIRS